MKLTLFMAIAMVAGTGLAPAQETAPTRSHLQRHDLAVAGREVIQVVVGFAPGVTAPRHTHPGDEVIYVLEGLIEYQMEGKPPVRLKAGEVLFVPAGTTYRWRNSMKLGSGSKGQTAAFRLTFRNPLPTPLSLARRQRPRATGGMLLKR